MPTLTFSTAPTRTDRPAWRNRIAAVLATAGIGLVAGALVAPATGAAATLTAQPASAFRDSIGVQTHFGFTGYSYDTASTSDLSAMLRMVGIDHLRDDLCFNSESACTRIRSRLAAMQDAFGSGGPKVDLLAGYTRELASVSDRATRDADIARSLAAATNSPLAPMVAGLEAVNEPDLKNTAGWASAALADDDTFQRLLAQPQFAALRSIPHLSPPIGHATNTLDFLASGWNKARATVGNFHPYPPAWGGPENGLTGTCGTTTTLGCAQQLGQNAPIATESGYTTSGSILSTSWVSEKAQAIYLPRLLLENFRSGVPRTYLYELVDMKPAGTGAAVDGYGLWRSRASSAGYTPADPKPAATAIARMNATIGDLGAGGQAAALDVTVRSAGREVGDDTVRRVLLRRADGTYVLALWQPKAVWDNTVFKQSDKSIADLPVDVSVGGATWTATATRPSVGDAATGRWNGASTLSLGVGADVTLIDLRADGSAPATVPAPDATNALPAPAADASTPATSTPVPTPTPTPKPALDPRKPQNAAQAAAIKAITKMFIDAITKQQKAAKAKAKRAKAARAKATRAKAARARRAAAR